MPEVSAWYFVSRLVAAKMTSASWIVVQGLQNLLLHLLISYSLLHFFGILLLFTVSMDVEEDAILKKDFIWELPDGSFPSIRTSVGINFRQFETTAIDCSDIRTFTRAWTLARPRKCSVLNSSATGYVSGGTNTLAASGTAARMNKSAMSYRYFEGSRSYMP